jgi:hypothetical protein
MCVANVVREWLTFGGTRTKSATEGEKRALAAKEANSRSDEDARRAKEKSRGACAKRMKE